MTDNSTPETVDEETPDDGEGEQEAAAEGSAPQEEPTATPEGSSTTPESSPDDGESESDTESDATTDADDEIPEPNIPDDVAAEAAAQNDMPSDVPEDVQKYARFQKMDGAEYDRVNEFLRDRTYVTAREWAIARLCADFRTETGVEMTKIGKNLPRLIPFMTDTYTPQAVNQARASFEQKVNKAGATFLYGAMSGFFTAEELDEMMYEVTEVAKFLLEVEGVDLSVEEELAAEDKISEVMREVRQSSAKVRGEEVQCPECGHVHDPN
jgi:hypothetical protein